MARGGGQRLEHRVSVQLFQAVVDTAAHDVERQAELPGDRIVVQPYAIGRTT